MKTGIELIAKERQEQIEKHGRTIEDDAIQNRDGELTDGAIAILMSNGKIFPNTWDPSVCAHMVKKPYMERLIIAGAFIAAELDRLMLNSEEHEEN